MRKGWETKKLGDVCDISAGGDVPKDDFSEVPMENKKIPIYANGEKNNGLYGYTSIAKVLKPSITVSARGTIGYAVKRLESFYPIVRLIVISPKSLQLLDLSYLDFILKSIDFKSNGTSIPQLTVPMIKQYEIPIPPLPEQQRIVSILDEAYSSIEQAKENLQRNLQNAKELFQSELNSIFTNKGEGWEEKSLGEVCNELFAGGDAPKENFSSGKTEINNIPIYANAVKDKGLYGFTNYARVTKPSISIAARGSGTGHTFLRQENYFPIVRLIVVIPNTKLIDLSFLKLAIDTLVIVRSGSAIPQLTIPMIKNYTIPFPSLETQKKIVQQLDKLSTETKRLEAMYQQKLDALEELKKSILQKAFSGELSEN